MPKKTVTMPLKKAAPLDWEALRQQVLKDQADALAYARAKGEAAAATTRDRESYADYPAPKGKAKRR